MGKIDMLIIISFVTLYILQLLVIFLLFILFLKDDRKTSGHPQNSPDNLKNL